jgi:hypothetical protein
MLMHLPACHDERSEEPWTALSPKSADLVDRLETFMDERVYPAEAVYHQQMADAGDPHFHPPIIEQLKAEAKVRGLWNLFPAAPDQVDRRAVQPRLRTAGRTRRAFGDRPRGAQLLGSGHRKHGVTDHVRDRRAEGAVAATAARGGDPLGVPND